MINKLVYYFTHKKRKIILVDKKTCYLRHNVIDVSIITPTSVLYKSFLANKRAHVKKN